MVRSRILTNPSFSQRRYPALRLRLLATLVATLVVLGLPAGLLFAQAVPASGPAALPASPAATGRLTGRVVDAETGLGLPDVAIQIDGTTRGTMSGVDGRYTIVRVPAGTISITVRRIGYRPKTVTGIAVPANGAVEQGVALTPASVQLSTVTVTASAERGSVNAALDQQRSAAGVTNAVSAQQIARSPDSDAAAAVQRVSGVTVQDGKYVFVRGLGERYTTATLNGARIPSPEPERRVVPLDLFPASLLQAVTTQKSFTPDMSGDFSGAQVNIQTREFPAARQLVVSTSTGANTAAIGKQVPGPRGAGLEWLALASGNRQLPAIVARAGAFQATPSQGEVNAMVNAFRNSWSPRSTSGTGNGSAGITFGGNDPVFGQRVGYVFSGTYAYAQEVMAGYERGQAQPGSAPGIVETVDRYTGSVGRSSVLWGGIANLSTLVGSRTRISLNNTYNRSADNEAREESGFSENLGTALQVRRLRYVERSVYATQFGIEQRIGANQQVDLALTASGTARREPDRSEFVQAIQQDPATGTRLPPSWLSLNSEGAVRTYGDLAEGSQEARLDYRFDLGSAGTQRLLKVGTLARRTTRDADNRAYSIVANLSQAERELPPEQIFDGRFAEGDTSIFRIVPLGQGGSYAASDRLVAGYAMADLALTSRLRLVAGARVERSVVEVEAQPTVGQAVRTAPTYTDVLPSLGLTLSLTPQQALRLSASQTLSRPEYRELAPIQYREVIGGDNVLGNADLRRTLIQNLDVRWEWYPSSGEVLSVGAFGKRFHDPIERVYLATSGTRVVTFANADGATNYGLEFEARKSLAPMGGVLAPLTVFSNVTLMQSEIRLGASAASLTRPNRPMVGQAPYVTNLGLTYASSSGDASATLLYNVVGKRIVNAAEAPLPDVEEQARQVLDLSVRFPLGGTGVAARLDARNLLDAPYRFTQGTVVREQYRAGRVFQVGLSWRPLGDR